MSAFTWRSESDEPKPERVGDVDDRLTADEALKRVRRGEYLRYTGDFHNARQLLQAMARRLPGEPKVKSALEAFRAERRARLIEHQSLSRVVVGLDRDYRLSLKRAPDVAQACREVWGEADSDETLVALKTLLGMQGAAQWRQKGMKVPGIKGLLRPHYGVFTPTRTDYLELLVQLPQAQVDGKKVFDIGTGTGVLAFLLLQRGAAAAVATDIDPRAVACARANAKALALTDRFEVLEADGYPKGTADLVICNPPWIPEAPKSRVDRAVFDEDNRFLTGFLAGLAEHLSPGGQGLLVMSDLAARLGLRAPDWLEVELARAGLQVAWKKELVAHHPKTKTRVDALHAARARELVTLFGLVPVPR